MDDFLPAPFLGAVYNRILLCRHIDAPVQDKALDYEHAVMEFHAVNKIPLFPVLFQHLHAGRICYAQLIHRVLSDTGRAFYLVLVRRYAVYKVFLQKPEHAYALSFFDMNLADF